MTTESNGNVHGRRNAGSQKAVSTYFARKFWAIRILAAVLLIVASPLILLLVIIVRCTSSGSGLYRQSRMGRHGKVFMMYKIRTMYHDAESVSGPVWCRPGDSRITPIGKVLRLLHLDELPQLINVVRGEMDLVGPRPERPVFVARLERDIPSYRDRLQVLPGVTGLAQINLPADETFECVRRKIVLDRAYIADASVALDVRILICTLLRMLGIRHGRAPHWLGISRYAQLVSELSRDSLATPPNRYRPDYRSAESVPFNGHGDCLALVGATSDLPQSVGNSTLEAAELGSLSINRPR